MCWAAAPFSSNSNSRSSPVAEQAVDAAGEADAVRLEAVAQAGLRDPLAGLELEREPVQVVEQLGVELVDVAGHDAAEEDARRSPARGRSGSCDRPRATRRVGAIGREWKTSSSARITAPRYPGSRRSDVGPEVVAEAVAACSTDALLVRRTATSSSADERRGSRSPMPVHHALSMP